MVKLTKRGKHTLREAGRERSIPRELTDSEMAQVAGAVSCSWFEREFGWITHGGYPEHA